MALLKDYLNFVNEKIPSDPQLHLKESSGSKHCAPLLGAHQKIDIN